MFGRSALKLLMSSPSWRASLPDLNYNDNVIVNAAMKLGSTGVALLEPQSLLEGGAFQRNMTSWRLCTNDTLLGLSVTFFSCLASGLSSHAV